MTNIPTPEEINLKALENSYYRLTAEVIELTATSIYAHCEIQRRDSMEFLRYGVSAKGNNRNLVIAELSKLVEAKLQEIGKPSDWNNPNPVRLLIGTHIKYKKDLHKLWNKLELSKKETEADFNLVVTSLINLVTTHAIFSCYQLASFTNDQLEETLFNSDSSFYTLENAAYIDAMTDMFFYVNQPSKKLNKLHNKHTKMFNRFIQNNTPES